MNIDNAIRILKRRISVAAMDCDHAYKAALETAVSFLERHTLHIGDRVEYYGNCIGTILHPDYMGDSVVVLSESFPLCPQVIKKIDVIKTADQNDGIAKSLKEVLKDLSEKIFDGDID